MTKDSGRCNRCGEGKEQEDVFVCDSCVQHLDAIVYLNHLHDLKSDEDEYIIEIIREHEAIVNMYDEVAYSYERN